MLGFPREEVPGLLNEKEGKDAGCTAWSSSSVSSSAGSALSGSLNAEIPPGFCLLEGLLLWLFLFSFCELPLGGSEEAGAEDAGCVAVGLDARDVGLGSSLPRKLDLD